MTAVPVGPAALERPTGTGRADGRGVREPATGADPASTSSTAASSASPSGNRAAGSLTIARSTRARTSAGTSAGQRVGVLADLLDHDLHGVLALEHAPAGQALVGDRAEGVDVAGRRRPAALRLLRREVVGGADDLAGAGQRHARRRPGDPEVGDLDDAVVGDQHVARLHVAVDEAGAVRDGQRGRGLPRMIAQRRRRRRAAARRASRAASDSPVDQFHDEVGEPLAAGVARPPRSRRRRRCSGGAAPRRAAPRRGSGRRNAASSVNSLRRIFTATGRLSTVSRPRQTRPMPPLARRAPSS